MLKNYSFGLLRCARKVFIKYYGSSRPLGNLVPGMTCSYWVKTNLIWKLIGLRTTTIGYYRYNISRPYKQTHFYPFCSLLLYIQFLSFGFFRGFFPDSESFLWPVGSWETAGGEVTGISRAMERKSWFCFSGVFLNRVLIVI